MSEALDFLFSRSSNGILVTDSEGCIQQTNAAAAALLDKTGEQLVGSMAQETFRKDAALLSLFMRASDFVDDIPLPRRRVASGTATTLDDGRRMVMLIDVTEQRELDARREAFIMTMAHDLRNPIAALIGYAELIHTVGDLNDEQLLYLSRVRGTATKLHDVAAELVDLAWIEAGMPLQRAPLALQPSIDSVIAELTPMAQAKGIQFFVSVQQPMAQFMGDEARVRLVVFKVIHNAIRYSGVDQVIAVHAWSDAQLVCCSVTDHGIGIAAHEIELVFDRLYRSRDPRVQAVPGGGLGLTMARRIVNRHGGEIWATSELDKGSTFTFKLPALQP